MLAHSAFAAGGPDAVGPGGRLNRFPPRTTNNRTAARDRRRRQVQTAAGSASVYGMARPSFRRRRIAGSSGGGIGHGFGDDLCSWRGSRQERLQRSGAGFVRRGRHASQDETRDISRAGGEAACVRCRNGGMLRRPPPWPAVRRPRSRRPADVARICSPLCQGAQERRSRRRGDRGSRDAAFRCASSN